jgi:hypothetical protein
VALARKKDDLSSEPTLHEALSDPVIRAVMDRDGVSRDELVRLILVARARLSVPADASPLEAKVLPFPVRQAPPERHDLELRPRTRWPFCLRAPGQT